MIAPKRAIPARYGAGLLNVLRALLLCATALLICPIRYHPANTGLDASWAVALNLFHLKNVIFGRDVGFTYGPLGYLILPMPFGSNLIQGLLFQAAMWFLFVALLGGLIFFRKIPVYRLIMFGLCAIPGADLFYEFGYAGPDLFLALLVLLLLGISVGERSWLVFYGLATGLAVLLMFIKISSGINAISSLLLLPLALLVSDHTRAWRMALIGAAVTPVLFALGYLLYYPSRDSLMQYVRSALDISSGYNTAMSLPGRSTELTAAVLMLAAYGLLLAALFWTRQNSFPIALAAVGSLFLEFKHSFVRQPGHTEILFTLVPLLLGLVLLFTDFSRRPVWPVPAAILVFLGVWFSQESGRITAAHMTYSQFGLRNATAAAKALDFPALCRTLENASRANLVPDRLPPELLARIAGKPLGVFPWESSYAAANVIDYRPFPIFQTYTASTPFLDNWDAEFLSDPERAPNFLLFEWNSIDGRHPLLDVPATSLAMFRQYEADSSYGAQLLLRKRARPLDGNVRLVRSDTLGFGQPLKLPESGHPLFARIYLRLNMLGQLLKFCFRIPEIDILLSSPAGRFAIARVPPDVMEDGIPVNFLPSNLDGAQALFKDGRVDEPFDDLLFYGPGAGDFENRFRAEIYEMPGIDLSMRNAPMPDLSALRYLGELDTARLESLNNTSAAEVPQSEVMELEAKSAMLFVQGWAFDNSTRLPASAVLIDLDGKLYPANYGDDRQDIVALFKARQLARTGFQWGLPAWKLGRSTHEISLKILSSDGKGYYDVRKKNQFRIVD